MPDNSPIPSRPQPWFTSPLLALAISIVFAAVGTLYLLSAGKTFGALAFGGANLLASLMWLVLWDRMARVCRAQTGRQAALSWLGGLAWAGGVVALYRLDYTMAATLVLCVVLLLYTASAWLVARGVLDAELGSDSDGKGGEL